MNALKATRIALQIVVLGLLGACAGGGGGGGGGGVVVSPPGPPPPPLPPLSPPHPPGVFPSASSAEYTNNWATAGTNAIIAWQHGSTGQGIKIGVIDDGIVATTDPSYAELTGRIDPASTDIIAGRNQLSTSLSHGSELSALIAGNFNGGQTVGVAFDATILAIRADNGNDSFDESDLANGLDYAVAHGVKVVNFSLGSASPTSSQFRTAIANATAAGVIIVVSAGNDGPGSGEVIYPGFLASDSSVSHGLIMIGGGLNSDGSFNGSSNLPGQNKDWYLTAPGWQIIVPDFGPPGPVPGFQRCGPPFAPTADTCQIQGTSYSSPHITGAVALVMAAFPGMTPAQVVNLILTTADDTGAPGTDSINGRGRLNIGRAFQPVGPLRVPFSGSGTLYPSMPLGSVGAAFGDGLSNQAGEWAMVGFDDFDRTFAVDLSSNWARAAAGPAAEAQAPLLWRNARTAQGVSISLAETESLVPDSYRAAIDRENLDRPATRIEGELGAGLSMSFAANGANSMDRETSEAVGHLGFVNADTSLTLMRRLSDFASLSLVSESGEAHVGLGQQLSQRSATATRLSIGAEALGLDVTYGRVQDEEGLLGLAWTNSLGETPGGQVRFAGVAGHYQVDPRLRLSFEAESGAGNFQQAGWLTLSEPLRTSAFSFEAVYSAVPTWLDLFGARASGALTFSVSQPLRVEDGQFSVRISTATAYGLKSLSYETRAIDPTPSGREMRFGLGYRYYAGDWLTAFGEALYVTEPGHVADADSDTIVRVGVRLRN